MALLTAILLWTGSAAGEGGNVSGGGGAIILPDDSVILADPYTPRVGSDSVGELSLPLRAELEHIGDLIVRYGASYPSSDGALTMYRQTLQVISSFISESVFDPLIEYRFVPRLPDTPECATPHHTTFTEAGTLENLACSMGPFTWIRVDLFQRMTLREQALTILHERLHTTVTPLPEEAIADITDGVRILLHRFNIQFTGDRSLLGGDEIHKIEILMRRIAQGHLHGGRVHERDSARWLQTWRVWPKGGGLLHLSATAAESAFVGVGSIAGPASRLGENSALVNTLCHDLLFESMLRADLSCALDRGAILNNTRLSAMGGASAVRSGVAALILGEDSSIQNSSILVTADDAPNGVIISLGRGSAVADTTLQGIDYLALGNASQIRDVRLYGNIRIFPAAHGEVLQPNVALILGDVAQLRGINHYFPSYFNAATVGATLTISTGAVLDYTSQDVCGAPTLSEGSPLNLTVSGALIVSRPEDLRTACPHESP